MGLSTSVKTLRTLDQLLPGQGATVKQVGGRSAFRHHIAELGLTAGANIKMVQTAMNGDPIEYSVNGFRLTLRRAEARVIIVEF